MSPGFVKWFSENWRSQIVDFYLGLFTSTSRTTENVFFFFKGCWLILSSLQRREDKNSLRFLSVFQFRIELFVSLPTYNTENSKQTLAVLYQNHFVLTKSRTQNSLSVFYQNHYVFIYLHITFRPSYFQFTINLKQINSDCWTQEQKSLSFNKWPLLRHRC